MTDWAVAEGQVLLVLDEFQHIARESPGVGTTLNVWWRERGRDAPILVVLSGSEVGFFEREVVSYSASAYGRRAGQLRLEPFKPGDVGLFLPNWTAEDRIRASRLRLSGATVRSWSQCAPRGGEDGLAGAA